MKDDITAPNRAGLDAAPILANVRALGPALESAADAIRARLPVVRRLGPFDAQGRHLPNCIPARLGQSRMDPVNSATWWKRSPIMTLRPMPAVGAQVRALSRHPERTDPRRRSGAFNRSVRLQPCRFWAGLHHQYVRI